MKHLTAIAAGCVALAGSVEAQTSACAPHDAVVERLTTAYSETRQSFGMGANNNVVETFANLMTGTWTVLVTRPNGISCIVASGNSFERLYEEGAPSGTVL